MSLTYSPTDTPIAIINEHKIVYLDKDGLPENKTSYMDMQLSQDEVIDLGDKLLSGMTIREAISSIDEILSEEGEFKEIELSPGEQIEVLPSDYPERVLVCAPSGLGKSTWAAGYAKHWLAMNPGCEVWIFVRTKKDPAFSDLDYNEVIVDKVEDTEFDLRDFSNTLCIFDDMDNLPNIKKKKAIHLLVNDLITNGRKLNIYTMYLSHTLMRGAETKIINNEANKVVLFNGAGDRQNLKFLQEYAGMKLDEARFIVSLKSRWVCLQRSVPRYLVHEKGLIML